MDRAAAVVRHQSTGMVDAWSGICSGSPSAPYGRPERALHPLHTTTLAPETGQDADGCSFQNLDNVHPGQGIHAGRRRARIWDWLR
jgi:hypothetical protein